MNDHRPDPDELLAQVHAEEAKQARGKLKVFFGAAPGVGKTYAMLEAARKVAKEGVDVVVGYVEPHARPETQALVLGLDVLPRRETTYGGVKVYEFDLEGAIARKPQLILVDELAHTNVVGSTHAKRWQDVEQILAAGINVYTTLNVQHLDSLNDVIAQITGVIVRETVPDSVFEQADEIELVDIAPDDLIERLHEGKVYVAEQAARAVQNFFRKGNLIALRELALRQSAERVDAQMTDFRRANAVDRTWPAADRLLVCVGPSPMSARLIRATRRMAAGLKSPWVAVHVETPADARLDDADRERLAQHLHLVEQLGGETAIITGHDVAREVIAYARQRNVTKIIAGKPQQSRWRDLFRGSYVYELTRHCGDIDVYVISGDEATPSRTSASRAPRETSRLPYVWSLAVVVLCTLIGWLMNRHFAPTNIVMVYLLGVLAVSMRFGGGPSIVAAVLGVAAFDFFFIPPTMTFAVADTQYLFTFAVMLLTGIVISSLTTRLKFQMEAARSRESRAAALYAMSREFAALEDREAIVVAGLRHVADMLDADTCAMLPGAIHARPTGTLLCHRDERRGYQPTERDEGVAQWVFEHGQSAGKGTATLPGADALYMPLPGARGVLGVLGVRPESSEPRFSPERMHLLETLVGVIALALERADLAHQSEARRVQVEAERLRNSLLSAVSHDLRTPLAAIAGASTTLLEADQSLSNDARRELTSSIVDETERLNRLVANLLDMTRLEGGGMAVQKQWQPVEEIVGVVLRRLAGRLASHRIEVRLPADLPLAPFDDVLIQQVLVNLVENAVKYAPAGSTITISAVAMPPGKPAAVVLEVADCGPGIPSGDEARVFDKFYRGGAASRRSGVGLGLAICRGIVELHGGRIWAENRPEGGATFRFTIPIVGRPPEFSADGPPSSAADVASHETTTSELSKEAAMSTPGPKILVVEDEQEIRRFLRVSLDHHGYRLVETASAKDAVLQAATQTPDLIILDLGLPDGDGLDVIRQIREWSRTPIIVLSARGQETDKVQALDLGADDYLTKPFAVGELLARLRVALRHAAQGAAGGEPTHQSGDLRVDLAGRQVFVADKEVHLTPTEYRLLAVLAKNAGKVVTHRQLLKEVWGPGSVHETQYLRVYMAALRGKIEQDSTQPKHLLTEPGVGYRLSVEAS